MRPLPGRCADRENHYICRNGITAGPAYMSNVEATRSLTRDGAIKLHGRDAFKAMHKAGRLAAAGVIQQ